MSCGNNNNLIQCRRVESSHPLEITIITRKIEKLVITTPSKLVQIGRKYRPASLSSFAIFIITGAARRGSNSFYLVLPEKGVGWNWNRTSTVKLAWYRPLPRGNYGCFPQMLICATEDRLIDGFSDIANRSALGHRRTPVHLCKDSTVFSFPLGEGSLSRTWGLTLCHPRRSYFDERHPWNNVRGWKLFRLSLNCFMQAIRTRPSVS